MQYSSFRLGYIFLYVSAGIRFVEDIDEEKTKKTMNRFAKNHSLLQKISWNRNESRHQL